MLRLTDNGDIFAFEKFLRIKVPEKCIAVSQSSVSNNFCKRCDFILNSRVLILHFFSNNKFFFKSQSYQKKKKRLTAKTTEFRKHYGERFQKDAVLVSGFTECD